MSHFCITALVTLQGMRQARSQSDSAWVAACLASSMRLLEQNLKHIVGFREVYPSEMFFFLFVYSCQFLLGFDLVQVCCSSAATTLFSRHDPISLNQLICSRFSGRLMLNPPSLTGEEEEFFFGNFLLACQSRYQFVPNVFRFLKDFLGLRV